MTNAENPLDDARGALKAGDPAHALRLAWKEVRPAVLARRSDVITSTMQLAEEIAIATDGSTQEEAEKLAAYCAACLLQPRDPTDSVWSMKRLFNVGGPRRRPCPDCAEEIAVDARVCRFCGFRLAPPAGDGD